MQISVGKITKTSILLFSNCEFRNFTSLLSNSERERVREIEAECSHLLVHFRNAYNSQSVARLKPVAWNSTQVSQSGKKDPITWATICCLNLSTPTGDVDIPSHVRATALNVHSNLWFKKKKEKRNSMYFSQIWWRWFKKMMHKCCFS